MATGAQAPGVVEAILKLGKKPNRYPERKNVQRHRSRRDIESRRERSDSPAAVSAPDKVLSQAAVNTMKAADLTRASAFVRQLQAEPRS